MSRVRLRLLVPHIVAIFIFFAINVIFFYPQLNGKVLKQNDILSHLAASKELRDYEQATGKDLYWTDALFGGMPTYQISNSVIPGSAIIYGEYILSFFRIRPIGYFLLMMVTYYLLMICMGISPWISIIGSIAFAFSTYHLVLFEAGHSNKIRSLAFIPLVMGGLLLLVQQRRLLLGGVMFTFGLALNLNANHIQLTYYFMLCAFLLAGIYLFKHIKEQDYASLLPLVGIALIGSLLAIGPSLANLWSTYEYSKETVRGRSILDNNGGVALNTGNSNADGLAWDYAMEWSNAGRDLWTLLAPRAVGGSNRERVKPGSVQEQRRLEGYPKDKDGAYIIGDLYWGGLPVTRGPNYYGAVILFLFVLGGLLVRGPVKWWLIGAVVLTLLLSLGKNLGWFQRLLFDYLPLYNKWRAPNSIAALTAAFLPLLGGLVLNDILKGQYTKEETLKAVYMAAGLTGGLALMLVLVGRSFFSFANLLDGDLQPAMLQLLIEDRIAFFRQDLLRSAGLILLAMSLIWAYLHKYIPKGIVLISLGLLIVGDVFSIGRRYIKPSDFYAPRVINQTFEPREVDQQILARESSRGDYRVYDMSIDAFNSAMTSFFHNSVGGYSAVKLRRYQDIIDRYLSKNHVGVLNMLNTKYIITKDGELARNPDALGPVWLVEHVKIVNTPEEEMEALNDLDPKSTAVVLDWEFDHYIGDFDPQRSGKIQRLDYDPQNLVYAFSSSSEQLAVFSEVWYPSSKGWHAYIDGVEVPFIRVNYFLRGLRIPKGNHEIRFEFRPKSIYVGGAISKFTGWIILLGFLIVSIFSINRYLNKQPA